jgi:pyruvate dehydrogenase E2 component (dihydrolipoamide acetyltransferase)
MDFLLPSLGPDMETGVLLEWKVGAGDEVKRGDVVAEVETDKGIIEVECWYDAVVEELLVAAGDSPVRVGTPLARLRTAGKAPSPRQGPPQTADTASAPTERVRATPRARHLARDRGIDLADLLRPEDGRPITADDVARAGEQGSPPAEPASGAAVRLAMARVMERSKREIPHYYLGARVDVSAAVAWIEARNEQRPITQRLVPAVVLLKATAAAARRVPEVNGHWVGGDFVPADSVHLGVAVSLREGGIVVPTIGHADELDVDEIASRLRALVAAARRGRVPSSATVAATLTVTSLGDHGVETVFPVIVPPQVAMVGFGAILEQPAVTAGTVGIQHVVHATLAADHRVSDGHRGSAFLRELAGLLRDPETL